MAEGNIPIGKSRMHFLLFPPVCHSAISRAQSDSPPVFSQRRMRITLLSLCASVGLLSCTTKEQKLASALEPFDHFISGKEVLDSIPDSMASRFVSFAAEFPSNEKSPNYLFAAAALFEKQGKTYRAAQTFESFLARYPKDPRSEKAYIGSAHNYELSGNFDKSRELYEQFLKSYPQSPMVQSVKDNLPLIGKSPEELLEIIRKKAAADSAQKGLKAQP
jgi:tetratricopeptide (TPR) repeat protein